MPLSYKIIKNSNVSCEDSDSSIIDTKIDCCFQESFLVETPYDKEYDDIINKDIIIEQMKKELLLELEQERLFILETARKESEELKLDSKEQGYKAGYEQGYDNGIKKAQIEGITIKNNALNLIIQAEQQVQEYFIENHNNVIKLAANMAESIVQNTIDETSENIIMLIKPVLLQFGKKGNIIISCRPENIAYIKSYLHELEYSCPDAKFILLEDSNLEKNGCIIENENQIIDLQIKKQIKSILEEIKDNKYLE